MRDWNFFPDKSKRIAVGLSGGVDSSMAAAKLVKMGYRVVGFWMWLSDEDSLNLTGRVEVGRDDSLRSVRHCVGSPREPILEDSNCQLAVKVCQFLKIPFYIIDFRKEFEKEVINYFLNEYKVGRTPNPCIVCNQKIKFGQMLKVATKKLKVDYLVTGHYARIVIEKSGIFRLLNGVDKNKDQSYFLYTLNHKKLAKLVFPNGSYFKEEIRKLAKKWQLPTKDAVESENICFIKNFKENNSYKENLKHFLNKNLKPKPGLVANMKSDVLGTHKGLCFYTIGSRGGWQLEAGNWKLATEKDRPRLYVTKIDKEKNQLIVGTKKEASRKEFEAGKLSWSGNDSITQLSNGSIDCFVKVRSAGKYLKAKLKKDKKGVKMVLEKPELGIAPGQSAVFYKVLNKNDYQVIGGGVIK